MCINHAQPYVRDSLGVLTAILDACNNWICALHECFRAHERIVEPPTPANICSMQRQESFLEVKPGLIDLLKEALCSQGPGFQAALSGERISCNIEILISPRQLCKIASCLQISCQIVHKILYLIQTPAIRYGGVAAHCCRSIAPLSRNPAGCCMELWLAQYSDAVLSPAAAQ